VEVALHRLVGGGEALAPRLAGGGAAAAGGAPGTDWPRLSRFYNRHLLPPALGLAEVVSAGAEDLQLDA